MRIFWTVLPLLLFVTASMVGCTEQQEPQPASSQEARTTQGEDTLSDSLSGPQVLDEVIAFAEITKSASNWKEADRKIRARLDSSSPVPNKFRESAAAEAMLRRYFDSTRAESLGPEKLEALSYYTNLFVENGNSSSPIVRPALEMLKNHWSNERLAAAIDTVIAAARDQYEITVEGIEPHIPDVHSDVRKANERLERLRERLQNS